jgi:gliding motility-associated-like protein
MKHWLTVGCIVVLLTPLQAQYAWFKHFTSANDIVATRLAIDTQKNVYTLVNFANDVTIQGNTFSAGALLVKLDSNGEFVWAKQITYSSDLFSGLSDLGTDGQDNVYITGQFPESATIEGTTITGGAHNSFIAKFSSAGSLVWVRTLNNVQEIFKMDVNSAGDVAIMGRHYQTFAIGHITLPMFGYNGFGALLDTDGNTQWAKVLGSGVNAETNQPISVAVDNDGNFFFCGRYKGQVKVDSKEVAPNAEGIYNMYYVKINRQGVCEWLVDGLRVSSPWGDMNIWEWGDLDTDDDGNVYGFGAFWNNLTIGSFQLNASFPFLENFYRFKIDPQGNVMWVKPGYNFGGSNHAENIVVKNGKLHVSGIFGSVPYYQAFNATDGEELTAMTVFAVHADIAGGLAIDGNDDVYMSGRRYVDSNGGTRNGFVFKLGIDVSVPPAGTVNAQTSICNGDKITASVAPVTNAVWYDWEFTYSDGTIVVLTTSSPDIEASTSSVPGATAVSIRVRGRSADATGQYSSSVDISIVGPPQPPVIDVVCNDVRVIGGETGEWFKDGEKIGGIAEGESSLTGIGKGEYYIVSDNGCGVVMSNKVVFEPVVIPNIITPNGDLKNDTFVVDERLTYSQIKIMNRWGEEVFASPDYKNDWSGDALPSGVYFYSLHTGCLNEVLKGSLTIAR